MKINNVSISGIHCYVPEKILTNKDLEKLVDTSDEWILKRTGIRERHILDEDKPTSYMGVKACKGLLEKTNTDPKDIDLIICATMTPDMLAPATANIISAQIGASNSFSFDLQVACSGFLYAMITGEKYIKSGQCKKVIIVGADKMSHVTNYKDRTTCVLFGDAAGAILLEEDKANYGIQNSILKSDCKNGIELLKIDAGGTKMPITENVLKNQEEKKYIYQEGRHVYKYAVEEMYNITKEIIDNNKLSIDDIKYLVPHQANERILESIAKRLNLNKDKVMIVIGKYGNTTAATIPLALWEYEKKLQKGDNIILTVFGAGFSWGASFVKWAYNSL